MAADAESALASFRNVGHTPYALQKRLFPKYMVQHQLFSTSLSQGGVGRLMFGL
jgi:hypothetical protein